MSKAARAGALVVAALLSSGCASVIMENTSPVKDIPGAEAFRTIPGTVLVKPGKPGEKVQNDVAQALNDAHVFTNAATSLGAGEAAKLELVVTSESKSNSHFGAEILKAILIGLTLSTTEGMAADKHDYSVTIHATLSKAGKELASYDATGSYHSEMPENRPIPAKVEHVQQNVKLSFEHALGLLVASIKGDRAKIVGQ